jgi:trimeric autotransporter adhesin
MPQPGGAAPAGSAASPSDATAAGAIRGKVTSGATPLPGVSITATNTLTGTKYTTATDVHGSFSMHITEKGRYVLRSDFAGFASTTKEVLLTGAATEQQADFALLLASRQRQLDQAEAGQPAGGPS